MLAGLTLRERVSRDRVLAVAHALLGISHGAVRLGRRRAVRPSGRSRVIRGVVAAHPDQEDTIMTGTRIQLALNVDDLGEAIAFYTRLFGVPPHKVRAGYANFAVADPPLKLVLIENPGAAERLDHLGVEAPTPGEVIAALSRFTAAGLNTTVAKQDACCHAVQTKVFVAAPDVPHGWWEYYAVTDDDPANPDGASTSVCAANCAAQDTADAGCCG